MGAAIRLALSNVKGGTAAPQGGNPYGGMAPAQQMPSMQPMQSMHAMPPPMQMQPMSMMGQTPPLTGVKRGSGDANEVQVHMVIPPKFIGAILGKEGAQIKQVTAETGCANVSVTRKEPMSSDRRVVILGGFEECVNAQKAVCQLYLSAAQTAGEEVKEINVLMMVPQATAGAVIGKEGANLKQIREQLGLRVGLSREQVEGFRPCNLAGPLESIILAERQIQEQVVLAQGEDRSNGTKRFGEEVQGLVPPEMKRPRVAGPGEMMTKLLVPAASAGAIIGKQGSVLKQIRESTGASLDVLPQAQAPHFTMERLVHIRGSLESKQAALSQVLQAAFDKDQLNALLKLYVPSASAGAVIGKQGSTLKAIRDQCGLAVQVQKEEFMGDRLVSASGSLVSVQNAASLILQALESYGSRAPPPPMTPQMGLVPQAPNATYWPQGME